MQLVYNRSFEKAMAKLPHKIKLALKERLDLFLVNPYANILNNHGLRGVFKHYRSINITGDYRLIYEDYDNNIVRLIDIGTHSELYN